MNGYIQPYTNNRGDYNRPGRALQQRELILREYPEYLEEFSRKRILIGANIMGVGMTRSSSPERPTKRSPKRPPEKRGCLRAISDVFGSYFTKKQKDSMPV
jgi:hypothetical protein